MKNKITMYYDSSCPICRTEAYHMRDNHPNTIEVITIDESLDELQQFGINKIEAMTYLCVKNTNGEIIKGIEAVKLLHTTAGTKTGVILKLPVAKQLASVVYPIFARNRYYIPSWVTKLMFGKVAEEECKDGVCNIPPDKR